MNVQQKSFKKRNITPLALLSQVKKSKVLGKERHSMLTLIEEEHKKMSYRYGQLHESREKKG